MGEHSSDHLLEGRSGGKEKKRKIKLFSEIMLNVEIWLILKCNLQFSSILFLKENISVQGAGAVSTLLLHHFLCQAQLAFKMYYHIDNANFKMMPFSPLFG